MVSPTLLFNIKALSLAWSNLELQQCEPNSTKGECAQQREIQHSTVKLFKSHNKNGSMLTVWRWAIEVFQWVVWLYLYSFCFGFTTLHVDTNRWKLKPCRVCESMNEKERERKKIKTQVDQNRPARASRFAPFSRMRWRRVLVYEWGCGGWAAWCVYRSSKPLQASAVKMKLACLWRHVHKVYFGVGGEFTR